MIEGNPHILPETAQVLAMMEAERRRAIPLELTTNVPKEKDLSALLNEVVETSSGSPFAIGAVFGMVIRPLLGKIFRR